MKVPPYIPDIFPGTVLEWFFWIFAAAWCIQMTYILFIFSRLGFHKEGKKSTSGEPVSVIICARNERENLLEFLPEIFNQNHPEFEVIVVNDASSDDTIDVLRAFSSQYPNLRVINIKENERFYYSKKYALTLGIKAAKYDTLLLTDADCKPASAEWISDMAASLSNGKQIVLGYGAHLKEKGLLNMLIRYDTFYTGLQYLSFCKSGLPYMGVGRNLAYKKELFFSNRGFAKHQHIQSGDDDLFINEVANRKNTSIAIRESAQTISVPKSSFRSWFRQKRRHLTTGPHYKFKDQIMLGLWMLSQVLFWVLGIALLISGAQFYTVLILMGSRILLQLIIFMLAMRKIGGVDLLLLSPLLEIFFIIFNPVIVLTNKMTKDKSWK